MSFTVENLEKNMAKLTIEVPAEEFEKAIQGAYEKNKGKIAVNGFRKGKVPRQMIEKVYGAGIFYEDAANALIPGEYAKAAAECGLDIVSQPEIDVTQIEKGKNFIFTATVALKPEVTLGEYLGVEIEKVDAKVSADDVKAELEKVREQNSRLVNVTTNRGVKDKDQTIIDFEGFVDGEAFEGGKGTDYPKLKVYVDSEKPDNVLLLNGLPKTEYEEFIKAFDVGLIFLDHRFEIPNFPSRLLSYMQNRMPVIACTDANTDIGKVITDGDFGWWCESNSTEDFTSVVDEACKSELSVMGEKAYSYLISNYTSQKSYETIISKIVGK